jgi:hypothetical protein
MNPLIKRQFDIIHEEIGRLRETLAANRDAVEKQRAQQKAALQENWRAKREAATLRPIAEDYDELDEENKRLRAEREALQKHLEEILRHTRALQNTYE